MAEPRPPAPDQSAAVLIGVSAYRHLPPLPAVTNNVTRLRELLTDRDVWGLPASRCRTVLDPATQPELLDVVYATASEPTETLFVYYAGHGLVDERGELLLTLPESRSEASYTSVPYDHLRNALRNSRAKRLIVILDCCYSARAFGQGDPQSSLQAGASITLEDAGTYVLTSAEENAQAVAPPRERYTAFTGELTRVISEGIRPRDDDAPIQPYLTLDMIYRTVRDALAAKGRPRPHQQDRGQVGAAPFVRNRADPAAPPPLPPGRTRLVRAIVAGVLAVALLAVVTYCALRPDAAEAAACSERAALLGFSDRLDKARHQGRPVFGLSSLAMAGPQQALALSDGQPLLYRLALGPAGGRPDVRITASTTLVRKDGSAYPGDQQFDGEAIALEPGRSSILVASESGPSISRFDLWTGRLLTGFEIPSRFQATPDGDATTNAIFESMALSADGRHLYVGVEAPFSADGTRQGRGLTRVLRYTGRPGGTYVPDGQFAYETASGLRIADFTSVGGEKLLVLERGYTEGQGNSVHVYQVDFAGLPDVTDVPSLAGAEASAFPSKRLVFDLGECPPQGAAAKQKQANPLLDNVEGMTLGPPLTDGDHAGRRPLYLVSDDNGNSTQTTRFYTLAINPF